MTLSDNKFTVSRFETTLNCRFETSCRTSSCSSMRLPKQPVDFAAQPAAPRRSEHARAGAGPAHAARARPLRVAREGGAADAAAPAARESGARGAAAARGVPRGSRVLPVGENAPTLKSSAASCRFRRRNDESLRPPQLAKRRIFRFRPGRFRGSVAWQSGTSVKASVLGAGREVSGRAPGASCSCERVRVRA